MLDLIALGEAVVRIAFVAGEFRTIDQTTQFRQRTHGNGNEPVCCSVDAVGRAQVGVGVAVARALWFQVSIVEVGCEHLEL